MNCEVAIDRDNLHLVRLQSSMRLFFPSSPCLQFLEYMVEFISLLYQLNGIVWLEDLTRLHIAEIRSPLLASNTG